MQVINHTKVMKVLRMQIFMVAIVSFFSFNSGAVVYNENPELKAKILSKMEEFCQKAGGIVTAFENTCANSCLIYDRKTGEKLKNLPTQCKEDKMYSCRCPKDQCLQYGKCQQIQSL